MSAEWRSQSDGAAPDRGFIGGVATRQSRLKQTWLLAPF
jgi:hypothetical protein